MAKFIRKEIKKQEVQAPVYDDTIPPVLDTIAIRKMLPHRWPFLMVDKIIEIRERSVVGVKNITVNETLFMGHFPDEPVMPGVLIIEALAQTGAVAILSVEENRGKTAYFAGINSAKFKRKVVPGDVLILETEIIKQTGPMSVGRATAKVGDDIACIAELTFAIS